MILWSIQPEEILDLIQKKGVYRCDPEKGEIDSCFLESYDWLVNKMRKRIGPPPAGVTYPVWAWYRQDGKHKKPDLRSERWCYGNNGEKYVCLEISIPSDQVLLSDFDEWHCVLNDFLASNTEEEYEKIKKYYEALPPEEQTKYKDKNWERIFNIKRLKNDWTTRGDWVQATFWELKKENIKKIRYFTSAANR